MVISVGSRSLLREVFARDGNEEETMGTLGTLERMEEKLPFNEYLLQTKCGPGVTCFIRIQLNSHNYSKNVGVSTTSHKEETEAQRSFCGLTESRSCYVKERVRHQVSLISRLITFPCVPGDVQDHLMGAVGRPCQYRSISLCLCWVRRAKQQPQSARQVKDAAVFRLQMLTVHCSLPIMKHHP